MLQIPLGGSEGDEDMLHTNFLHNTVARIHKYTIQFVRCVQFAVARASTNFYILFQECQRGGRDPSGARIWEANLFGGGFFYQHENLCAHNAVSPF
jgi:hypothetical protein